MSPLKQSIALAAFVALLFSGCGAGQVRGVSSGGRSWTVAAEDPIPGIHKGAAEVITLKCGPPTGVTIVVWCADASGVSSHGSAGGFNAFSEGSFRLPGELQVGFRCETSDGARAKVTIADRTYDTTNGSLFLISPQPKATQVKQLDVDITNFPKEAEAIVGFAIDNPDVAAFFKDATMNVSSELDE